MTSLYIFYGCGHVETCIHIGITFFISLKCFHSQYIPYVSYFHIYVFLFCDDELYMLKSNKFLFCSVLFLKLRPFKM